MSRKVLPLILYPYIFPDTCHPPNHCIFLMIKDHINYTQLLFHHCEKNSSNLLTVKCFNYNLILNHCTSSKAYKMWQLPIFQADCVGMKKITYLPHILDITFTINTHLSSEYFSLNNPST